MYSELFFFLISELGVIYYSYSWDSLMTDYTVSLVHPVLDSLWGPIDLPQGVMIDEVA